MTNEASIRGARHPETTSPAPRRTDVRAHGHGPRAVVVLQDVPARDLLDDLRRQLPRLLDDPPTTLVADLSRQRHFSSGTVAALLWLRDVCRARGVDVRLRRLPRGGGETLRRTGLSDALPLDAPGR